MFYKTKQNLLKQKHIFEQENRFDFFFLLIPDFYNYLSLKIK